MNAISTPFVDKALELVEARIDRKQSQSGVFVLHRGQEVLDSLAALDARVVFMYCQKPVIDGFAATAAEKGSRTRGSWR
jgi:hypothetical protein